MDTPFNMADLFGKMQEMQQKLEESQQTMLKGLAERTVTTEVGGGMVTVTVDGTGKVRAIKMERAVVNPDDPEMLEDLLVAGINKALDEANALREAETRRMATSMLPPGLGSSLGF